MQTYNLLLNITSYEYFQKNICWLLSYIVEGYKWIAFINKSIFQYLNIFPVRTKADLKICFILKFMLIVPFSKSIQRFMRVFFTTTDFQKVNLFILIIWLLYDWITFKFRYGYVRDTIYDWRFIYININVIQFCWISISIDGQFIPTITFNTFWYTC